MQTGWRALLSRGAIFAIVLYRNTLSRLMFHSCRFFPTCSEYAMESIRRYGVVRGGWRSGLRILRCQPFSRGGFDPVS